MTEQETRDLVDALTTPIGLPDFPLVSLDTVQDRTVPAGRFVRSDPRALVRDYEDPRPGVQTILTLRGVPYDRFRARVKAGEYDG